MDKTMDFSGRYTSPPLLTIFIPAFQYAKGVIHYQMPLVEIGLKP